MEVQSKIFTMGDNFKEVIAKVYGIDLKDPNAKNALLKRFKEDEIREWRYFFEMCFHEHERVAGELKSAKWYRRRKLQKEWEVTYEQMRDFALKIVLAEKELDELNKQEYAE